MRKPTVHYRNPFIFWGTAFLFFTGCKNSNNTVPFPTEESEFAQPVARTLKFSEPVPIEWAVTSPDSIKPLPVIHFDFNKLPSKPFDIGGARPLLKPLDEKKFDWNSLPDTAFNLYNLPSQKLKFKTSLLGAPKIVKAGIPAIRPGTSRGILEAGTTLGLPGLGRCFLQDKYGIIWIGTDKGLCRYDGENVEIYSTAQGITDPNIFSIFEDEKEQIWIGTNSAETFVINQKAGILRQIVNTFKKGTIFGITEDDTGRIWMARNEANVLIIDPQKETIQELNEKNGLMDNSAFNMYKSSQGLIWITGNKGVNVIDLKSGKNKKIKKPSGLSSEFIISVMEDDKNRIWLGGSEGVYIIDINANNIKHLWTAQGMEHSKYIDGFMQDKEGKYWIGTDTGTVYTFDEKKSLLEKLKVNIGDNNDVINIMEDNSGQIWMGSAGGACYIYNPNSGKPGNFTIADGLTDNNIWSTLQDNNGLIWIGSNNNGIDIYNPVTKTIKHIGKEQGLVDETGSKLFKDTEGRVWTCARAGPGGINIIDINKGTIQYLSKAQGLAFNNCTYITEDNKGLFWISSRTGQLQVINLKDKVYKTLKNSADYNSLPIYTIYQDRKGKMWIGSRNAGIVIADLEKNTIRHLNTVQGLSSNEVYALDEDADGNMWIGTIKGIDYANLQKNTLSSFTVTEGLVNNEIWTLNEHNGSMYAGTTSGLSILTKKQTDDQHQKWEIISIGKAQGLSFLDFAANSTSFINNQLWGGVERQILTIIDEPKFDTTSPTPFITGINIMDKPQHFFDNSIVENELKNIDTLWKTGNDSFYLNKQFPTDSGYLKNNKIKWDSTEGSYLMPVNLRLPHNQNYLSFTFTGNQVSNPDKTRYRYILEGIDKNWSPISEKGFSENYRDLPPGDYTFKVSSKGINGIWSKAAAFDFTILPPWWKTWWAYLIYGLLFLGALRVFSKWRERKLRYEKEKLELKVNHRTKQLQESIENLKSTQSQLIQAEKMASLGELTAGIAHEIQNPLNFVNNFSEVNSELIAEMKDELTKGNMEEAKTIANDIDENEKKIIFHGKRADAIVKGMLQHSRSSSGQKEPTDINALADEYFRLAYHGLRAKDKSFNATMRSDFDPGLEKINVVTQEIGRVILNLITNAFYSVSEKKKAPQPPEGGVPYEPTVWVTTKKIAGKIEVIVKDNGLGVPQKVLDKIFQPFFTTKPVGQGTGLGLSLSYDIIKAHGGELKVETNEGEGATFTIQLPV